MQSTDAEPRSRAHRLIRWGLVAVIILAATAPLAWAFLLSPSTRFGLGLLVRADGAWADLRNPAVLAVDDASRERGRAMLLEAARRHGLEAWRSHRTVSVTATDVWTDPDTGWWPTAEQRFRQDALIGTFTSRVRLLDGPRKGAIWGLQAWHPYRQAPAATSPTFLDEPAMAIEFYLPTLQYFSELPLRLLSAELVADAGEIHHRGRDYDLVFATWGDWTPHGEHDQYVVWIGAESGLIEKVHYTLREAVDMADPGRRDVMRLGAIGTMHFEDYRPVEGVRFPFRQIVTLFGPAEAPEDPDRDFLHRLDVESVRFDAVTVGELLPRSDLAAPSDRKVRY